MIYVVRVKGDCRCAERQEAQRNGEFFFVPLWKGYVFADKTGTPRRADYTPFVWQNDCPFCGGSLNLPEND